MKEKIDIIESLETVRKNEVSQLRQKLSDAENQISFLSQKVEIMEKKSIEKRLSDLESEVERIKNTLRHHERFVRVNSPMR